jgi:hypothetical protein
MIVFISKKYQRYQVYQLYKVIQLNLSRKDLVYLFKGAIVAKPQPFDCHDPDISGPDIFQKLVPMVNHIEVRNNEFVW